MQNPLFINGLVLLVFGMGVVFIFLGLLVVAVKAMSIIFTKFIPEPEIPPEIPSHISSETLPPKIILDVIQSAIAEHRKQHSLTTP